MRELAPGLWDWQSAHPEWEEGAPWGPVVSSHALDDGERLLLFDPLDVPGALRELAGQRETAIVLTAPWHERDTQQLVGELGVPVYAARPDTAQDLIDTFDVSPDRVEGFVSTDLRWLIHEDGGEFHAISPAEPPPFGIEAFRGRTHNDLVLWVEGARAVIAGDSLADWGTGLAIQSEWLTAKVTREDVAASLRPLLDRPVEHVLPAHGSPTDRAALERALG
jgi:glyoxylase-like metal-dependent hydrolase (beta-lactamase superfamily II)